MTVSLKQREYLAASERYDSALEELEEAKIALDRARLRLLEPIMRSLTSRE